MLNDHTSHRTNLGNVNSAPPVLSSASIRGDGPLSVDHENVQQRSGFPRIQRWNRLLAHDSNPMDNIRPVVNQREKLYGLMSNIRDCFSTGRYQDAEIFVDQANTLVLSLLMHGIHRGIGLLRTFFRIGVYRKVVRAHRHMFLEGQSRNVLQVMLVLEKGDRQAVLLQHRGGYKRLFPDKLTVSASCRWPGDDSWRAFAEKEVLDEVGIEINPARLKLFEEECPRTGFLMSFTFEALTQQEEEALAHEARSFGISSGSSGITLAYDTNKGSLDLFTVDPKTSRYDLNRLAEAISRRSKVPFIYPVCEHTEHRLAYYFLDEEEIAHISGIIDRTQRSPADLPTALENGEDQDKYHRALKALDADTLVPLDWQILHDGYQVGTGGPLAPSDFAMDMAPIFLGDNRLYENLGLSHPLMVDVDDVSTRLLSVAGGKGSNLHILRTLALAHPHLFDVPDAGVVTVAAYRQNVLGEPGICKLIQDLDKEDKENQREQIAEQIRELIGKVEICEPLIKAIEECCERLGPDILMVRSSATVEDLKEGAAAGHGRSFPAKGAKDVINKVKQVWASLFTPEFVKLRWEGRDKPGFKNIDAGMAVVVQKAVKPIAAGVVTSVAAGGLRPIFTIEAKPGFGGSVVDGEGNADKWHVGILGDAILERDVRIKGGIQDIDSDGQLQYRREESREPSIDDEDIIAVARACRQILLHYREHKLAENIDVEYVVGKDHRVYIVQARSEPAPLCVEGSDGKRSLWVRMVDKDRLPATIHPIAPEDRALCACPGSAVAPVQVINAEEGYEKVMNGSILVTYHTNNSWNDVFGRLKGIITEEGGETSHAAKNSRALGIPCIVGWKGAVNALSGCDGKRVTIDAFNRRLYEGDMPVCEKEVAIDLWLDNEDKIRETELQLGHHEIARSWPEKKKSRPEIFHERFDGHWRYRSSRLKRFQLDGYYQAWDCLTDHLNAKYESRAPWKLAPQLRHIRDRKLYHFVPACDERSIYHFLANLKGADIQDALELYDERSNAFDAAGQYFNGLPSIDAGNVDEVVGHYVRILSWMHIAYWLNALVSEHCLKQQLKYVEPSSHELLRDIVARTDTKRLRRQDISREKDAEIHVIVEKLRRSVGNLADVAFAPGSTPEKTLKTLHASEPCIADQIEELSLRYKAGDEDMSVISDTQHYLEEIGQFLADGTLLPEKLLQRLFRDYLEKHHSASMPNGIVKLELELDPSQIEQNDPSLYLLMSSHARQGQWSDIIGGLAKEIAREIDLEKKYLKALTPFPALRDTLLASRLETTLREDGHHLIVRIQRTLAKKMIEIGRRFFPDQPERVFELSTYEFVSLVKTGNLDKIGKVARHWGLIDRIEQCLKDNWDRDPRGSLMKFEGQIGNFIKAAGEICKGDDDLRKQWQQEKTRFDERIGHLRNLLDTTQDDSNDKQKK